MTLVAAVLAFIVGVVVGGVKHAPPECVELMPGQGVTIEHGVRVCATPGDPQPTSVEFHRPDARRE